VSKRFPPAKLNWSLQVLGRRSDGFHELCSWFFAIDWRDCLRAQPAPRAGLVVTGPEAATAPPGDNLVLRAEAAWRQAGGQAPCVRWTLTKEIPAGTGLGGGSSDAVAALQLLQELATQPLAEQDCLAVAAAIGSDLPYFLTAIQAELRGGRGEQVLARAPAPVVTVLVAVPPFPVATAAVYAALDAPAYAGAAGPAPEREPSGRPGPNDLEAAAHRAYPELAAFAATLREHDDFHMSGSGGAYFAAFVRFAEAETSAASLRGVLPAGTRLRIAKPCALRFVPGRTA